MQILILIRLQGIFYMFTKLILENTYVLSVLVDLTLNVRYFYGHKCNISLYLAS
jgi:hypothetical protein